VNLLVVPPGSAEADALGAMDLAAQAVNFIRVPEILATLTGPTRPTEQNLSRPSGSPRAAGPRA